MDNSVEAANAAADVCARLMDDDRVQGEVILIVACNAAIREAMHDDNDAGVAGVAGIAIGLLDEFLSILRDHADLAEHIQHFENMREVFSSALVTAHFNMKIGASDAIH